MKIFCAYLILNVDAKQKRTFLLSENEKKISLPIIQIEHPRHLYNEIKYNTRYLLGFHKNIEQSIAISYIDIQNSLMLDYIDSLNDKTYDTNQDLFLSAGIVINASYENKLFWNEFFFGPQMLKSDPVIYHMIDNTIKRAYT